MNKINLSFTCMYNIYFFTCSAVEEPQLFNLWQYHAKYVQQSTSRKSHAETLHDSGFPSKLNLYLIISHPRLSE